MNPFHSPRKHVPTYLHPLQSFEIKSSFLNTMFEENQDNGQGPKLKVISMADFNIVFTLSQWYVANEVKPSF